MKTQFITDNQGKKVAVVLSMDKYQQMLDNLEEMECVKAYDKSKQQEQEFIDAEQAFKEIEIKRKQQ